MCFGACEHQHGTPDQRGADYAEALETCRSSYSPQTARFPVPKQGRGRNRCKLAPEPEIFGNCNCICAEVLQNRVQMSVWCLSVRTLFNLIKLAGPCFGALRRRYSCNSRKRPQFLIGSKIPLGNNREKVDQKMSARCEVRNGRITARAYLRKFRAKREIC